MDRRDFFLKHVTRAQRGIEIGPYFSPIAPKRDGFRCLSLDVVDADTLRGWARNDPNVPEGLDGNVEEVDLVGSATRISTLVPSKDALGTFDYVIASHNLEHIPDPIRFLQGCEEVLRPGGVVLLAVPDRRATFDFFRPFSTTGDLLQAHFEARECATPAQVFAHTSLHCRYVRDGSESITFRLGDDPTRIAPFEDVEESLARWKRVLAGLHGDRSEAHCWVFTPASLELILRDLSFLRVLRLDTVEVTGCNGFEFYVRLRNRAPDEAEATTRDAFYRTRRSLLHRVVDEAGEGSSLQFTGAFREAQIGARQEVDDLKASWSWRLTAPLRFVADKLRRGR
jgi:SAM-dependent methyltransferase